MELVEIDDGWAVVRMTVRADMVNGHGLCHGGLVATLADSAFAVACNSRGVATVAAGFDVSSCDPHTRVTCSGPRRPSAASKAGPASTT